MWICIPDFLLYSSFLIFHNFSHWTKSRINHENYWESEAQNKHKNKLFFSVQKTCYKHRLHTLNLNKYNKSFFSYNSLILFLKMYCTTTTKYHITLKRNIYCGIYGLLNFNLGKTHKFITFSNILIYDVKK